MKKSIKAALLSGLVFPGLGHIALKYYLRGSILIIAALAALSVIVTVATRLALATVDRIERGEISADMTSLTDLATGSVGDSSSTIVNMAMIVLLVCWVAGIIDSYRVGRAMDNSE